MTNYRSDQEKFAKIYGWHVYVIAEDGAPYSKIGTAAIPAYRISGLQNGNPRRLTIAGLWHVKSRADAFKIEKAVHVHLTAHRLAMRDWFSCPPDILVAAVETLNGLATPAARRIV